MNSVRIRLKNLCKLGGVPGRVLSISGSIRWHPACVHRWLHEWDLKSYRDLDTACGCVASPLRPNFFIFIQFD